MKIFQYTFVLFLIPVLVLAQNTAGDKGLHYGFSLAPKANWFLLKDKEIGESKIGLSLSLYGNVYYDISSRLQLRSGLGLHSITTSNKDYSPTFGCDSDGQGGFDQFNSFYDYSIRTIYLGIPIDAKLKLTGDANHLYWRFGAEVLFRLSTKDQIDAYECGTDSFELHNNSLYNPRKSSIILQTGFGYEWKIKQSKFFIEPMLSYGISKTFEDVGISSSLIVNGNSLQVGVLFGMIF